MGNSLTPDSFERPKPAWFWMKDDKGNSSVTVTFVTVAFWVTTFLYIASAFESLGPIHFRTFDVAACGAYFAPLLALYWGRKHTDAKYPASVVPGVNPQQTGDEQQ